MKCKRENCEKEAARGQIYCSKDCAPYGRLGLSEDSSSTPKRATFYTRALGEQSQPSNEKTLSTVIGTKKQSSPQSSVSTRGTDKDSTTVETKPTFLSEPENDARPGPQSNVLLTHEKTGQKNNSTMNEQEKPGMRGTRGTEMTTTEKKDSGAGNVTLHEDSSQLQKHLSEARSHTMSLIDESANVLLDCMKSAAKRSVEEPIRDFRQVNAIANVGKQIAQLAKVKLDAIKDARR